MEKNKKLQKLQEEYVDIWPIVQFGLKRKEYLKLSAEIRERIDALKLELFSLVI